MSKVLKNLYLTPSQVAGGVSEFQKSQLTGEDISRKFRRILETIEKEVEGAQLNCLYKSKSRRKDRNVNSRIFNNPDKMVNINKRMQNIDVMAEGALTEYCKLVDEGKKLDPDYRIYRMDPAEVVYNIFELWETSKKGYFNSCEIIEFTDLLISLIPKGPELEKSFADSKMEADNIMYEFFFNRRTSSFYEKRILKAAFNYSNQYQLVKEWSSKWNAIMDIVLYLRKNMELIEKTDENWYVKNFSIRDFIKGILISYDFDLLRKYQLENEKKNKHSGNRSRMFMEKDSCINCVNDVVNAKIKYEFEEDYYFILDKAFMELEDIGRTVNADSKKDKSRDYNLEKDYNKIDTILKKCLDTINPHNAEVDLNYVRKFGVEL